MAPPERPVCQGCVHYYVTYDMERPHGCRQFGFVSRRLPSLEVLSASGTPCTACEQRPAKAPGRKPGLSPKPDRREGDRGRTR